MTDLNKLASDYLQKDNAAAFDIVCDLIRDDPNKGWELVRVLVQTAKSDAQLAYIAAGPLEDLLKLHGPAVIDQVEEESRKNDRMRLALSGVWGLEGKPVFSRWNEMMNKYGFRDGRRKPF